MKYLLWFKEDTVVSSRFPPKVIPDLVEASHGYLEALRKEGKIVDSGFFAGKHGGYAIFNVNTLAELYQLSENLPVRAICDVEAFPVMDMTEFPTAFARVKK